MKKVNLLLGCFKTYLIKRYLRKELERKLREEIKKLNPIHILAEKNGLSLKSITPQLSISEDFCFPEVEIYEDFLENKYVPTNLGFVPLERYNAQIELLEIHIKYSDLLNKVSKLEEKEVAESKKMELKISELNSLIRNLNHQIRTLKNGNQELETLKKENGFLKKELVNITLIKKENKKLEEQIEKLKNDLASEKIKNTNMIMRQTKKRK